MIDTKLELIDLLEVVGLPVYHESFVKKQTNFPCITYSEVGDVDVAVGDTIAYSQVSYEIKIYDIDLESLAVNSAAVDSELKKSNFRRYYSDERFDGRHLIKTFRYSAFAAETL